MFLKIFLIGCLSLLISACSMQDMQNAVLPEEIQAELEAMNAHILAHDSEAIKAKLHPAALTAEIDRHLIALLSYVPKDEPVEIKLATAKFTTQTSIRESTTTTYTASYQLEFPDKWMLFMYVLMDDGSSRTFYSVHVNQSDVSYQELNALTLKNKGPAHYLTVAAAIFNVVLIVWMLVVAIRMKDLKRKIAWIIFIGLGFQLLTLNWTTGEVFLAFVKQQGLSFGVQILGAGIVSAGPYSPWILKVSLPIGAILFLIFWKRGTLKLKTDKKEKA